MSPAILARLTPEQRQRLEDADRWNAYADTMNAKAVAAGIVDAETVRRDHEHAQQARRELLARWGVRDDA